MTLLSRASLGFLMMIGAARASESLQQQSGAPASTSDTMADTPLQAAPSRGVPGTREAPAPTESLLRCGRLFGKFEALTDVEFDNLKGRVGAAEFLFSNKVMDPEIQKLLLSVAEGRAPYNSLPREQKNRVDEAIDKSDVVKRLIIERYHNDFQLAPEVREILGERKLDNFIDRKMKVWERVLSWFWRRRKTIPFDQASTYVDQLTKVPTEERLSELKYSLEKVKNVTHSELFELLAQTPEKDRAAVIDLIQGKLITPVKNLDPTALAMELSRFSPEVAKKILGGQTLRIPFENLDHALKIQPDLVEKAWAQGHDFDFQGRSAQEIGAAAQNWPWQALEKILVSIARKDRKQALAIVDVLQEGASPQLRPHLDELAKFEAKTYAIPDRGVDDEIAYAKANQSMRDQILADYATKHGTALSADDVVKMADAAFSSEGKDKVIQAFAGARMGDLSPAEIVKVMKKAISNVSTRDPVGERYFQVHTDTMTAQDAVLVAGSVISTSIRDRLLFDFAKARLDSLSKDDLMLLSKAGYDSSTRANIADLVRLKR
jgi:hypothetical protein